MKTKVIFFLVSSFLFCAVINAQWNEQFYKSDFVPRAIYFLDEVHGWVATDLGEIYKTNDGGINWNLSAQINARWVNKIQFESESIGYINFPEGLYKTINGGITWTLFFNNQDVRDFFILNNAVYVLSKNQVNISTDNGSTWQQKIISNNHSFNAIYFNNNNHGWAFDPWGTSTELSYFTDDSGLSWKISSYAFKSIYFLNDNIGWAGTLQNELFSTTDGGNSWKVIKNNIDIFKIEFTDNNNGWYYTSNKIFRTSNGGNDWTEINTNVSERTNNFQIRDFFFVDNNNGWITGSAYNNTAWVGNILKYDTTPKIKIFTPANNETLYTKNLIEIKWSLSNVSGQKGKLEFSTNAGNSWNLIADSVKISAFKYSWKIPDVNSSQQCLIKLTEYSSHAFGISSPFQIAQESMQLFLRYPIGGEVFQNSQEITIRWDANYSSTSNVVIEFIPSQMYKIWEVPINSNSLTRSLPYDQNQYRIKISDKNNPNIMDVSDLFWVKEPPSIYLISPNGKESWQRDSVKTIKLGYTNIDKIKLEYSINSGANWIEIANNIQADSNALGSSIQFSWKIPNTISSLCLVRASSKINPAVADISDNVFEITDKNPLTIFPLDIGNIWYYGLGGYNKDNYIVLEVLKDTLINGAKYFKISRNGFNNLLSSSELAPTTFFLRQNGSVIYSRDKNQTSSGTLIDFSNPYTGFSNMFGKNLKYYTISVGSYAYATIDDSIGYETYYSFNNGRGTKFSYTLFYCELSGKKYGNDITSVDGKKDDSIPIRYELAQNYPNPFNPETIIRYQLPVTENVKLKIYDVLGREIATLVDEVKAPGNYEVKFNGSNLSSGIYFYRLNAGSFSNTKKFILLK